MSLVTVIGRGHSGTRAISHTLTASGVFMGSAQNKSGDLLPPEPMYEASRVLARYVTWSGGCEWKWDELHRMSIPNEFSDLINMYLAEILQSDAEHKGWKIPETTLVFPWIVRMFPEAHYIFWIRDPRDCIMGKHLTDDLSDFGVPYPPTEDERLRRAFSWKYQFDLVRATPRPKHWIEVRFEDFVLDQEVTLSRLEAFLGFPLARIAVNAAAVGRWRSDPEATGYDFLTPAIREFGYDSRNRGPNSNPMVNTVEAGCSESV